MTSSGIRYRSIDLMRGYAVAVMVIVHFLENLAGTRDWSPDGFGAPIFVFLTGVSYRLWLESRHRRGVGSGQISQETIRRGLFLVGLGFVFNALVWLPEDLFTWDVLTFLGCSMCALNVVRMMPTPAVLLAIVLSIVLSPVMQQVVDYPAYWVNGYFETELTLSELLSGFLDTGYFPIFPWIALPLSGFVAAPVVLGGAGSACRLRAKLRWFAASAILLVLAIALLRTTWPQSTQWLPAWTMFPASVTYLTGVLGMVILLLSGLHGWIDEQQVSWIPGGLLQSAQRFSRYSLTIYLVHHAVHLWPLWIYGYYSAGAPTLYWGVALPWWPAFLLSLFFLICSDRILKSVERRRVPTVETCMRWLSEQSG
ncbi:MAG: heparan-alpha-glucosaminide N-acetyltransferase domain-containing protein [Planctomycetaceae bacterium]